MSWNLLVMSAPAGVAMGPRDEVVAAVRATLPEAEPAGRHLRVESETYTIELDLGDGDEVNGLNVRAQGSDEIVGVLAQLCARNGWRALDHSTGEFLDEAEDPAAGLRGWRALLD